VAGRDLHRARPRDARAAPHPARLAPRYFRHGARGRRRHAQSDAETGRSRSNGSRRWSPRRSSSRRRAAPPSPPARRSSSASTRRSGGPRRSATAAGSPRSDRPRHFCGDFVPGVNVMPMKTVRKSARVCRGLRITLPASVLRDVPRRQVAHVLAVPGVPHTKVEDRRALAERDIEPAERRLRERAVVRVGARGERLVRTVRPAHAARGRERGEPDAAAEIGHHGPPRHSDLPAETAAEDRVGRGDIDVDQPERAAAERDASRLGTVDEEAEVRAKRDRSSDLPEHSAADAAGEVDVLGELALWGCRVGARPGWRRWTAARRECRRRDEQQDEESAQGTHRTRQRVEELDGPTVGTVRLFHPVTTAGVPRAAASAPSAVARRASSCAAR
jgi:hypothetical protein